jgi:hypothetical protein
VALCTAARPVPRLPENQNVPRSIRRREQSQNSPTKVSSLTIKFVVVLASTVTLGSESHETHNLMLLCDDSGKLQISDHVAK